MHIRQQAVLPVTRIRPMRRAPLGLLLGSLVVTPAITAAQVVIPPAIAQQMAAAHVQSSGRGEVRITPDHAIVTMVVDTRGDTAVKAAAENARRYDALLDALRAAGVSAQQVSSPGYTVASSPIVSAIGFATPSDVYTSVPPGALRPPSRTPSAVVRRSVRLDPVRMADVDRVVQAALTAGATQVGVQLAAPSLESAQRAAFTAAVADARSNADAMARAAGGTLGRLMDLNTSFSPYGSVTSYAVGPFEGNAFAVSSPLMVRDVTVVAVVTGRWELSSASPAASASK